jgi:cell wall-associated NlpC family hydrolase
MAETYLGTPYVWGGNSLTRGVDCSGFVQQLFNRFGINLNRTASTQSVAGVFVEKDELEMGDLLFFARDGRINHVAIYIADGKFIHSGRADGGISYNYLHVGYYRTNYLKAKRVL